MKNNLLLILMGILFFTYITPTYAIISHRAYYKVTLLSVNPDSEILDANGEMVIEMEDVCDGWTIEQKSWTNILLKTQPSESLKATYVAWESKAGDKLRFFAHRAFNNKIFEDVSGEARFTKAGGVKGHINFTKPKKMRLPIKSGTLPPITHLHFLINSAKSGQHMVSQEVFDGSFFGNPVQINTFIGIKAGTCALSKGKASQKMLWPMNLAVYGTASTRALPNFEIKQQLLDNGIMCSYIVDFGDYRMKGELIRLEYMPKNSCGSS